MKKPFTFGKILNMLGTNVSLMPWCIKTTIRRFIPIHLTIFRKLVLQNLDLVNQVLRFEDSVIPYFSQGIPPKHVYFTPRPQYHNKMIRWANLTPRWSGKLVTLR